MRSRRIARRYFNVIRGRCRSLLSRLETYKLRRGVSTALLICVHILLAALRCLFLTREELRGREGLEKPRRPLMAELFWRMRESYRTFVTASRDKRRKRGLGYHLATGPDSVFLSSSSGSLALYTRLFSSASLYSSIIPRGENAIKIPSKQILSRELEKEWRSGSRDWSLMNSTKAISFIIGCPVACWTTHDKKHTRFSSLLSVTLERLVFVSLSFTIYRSEIASFSFVPTYTMQVLLYSLNLKAIDL